MKVAIVVGHNAQSQGAVRVTDKRTEFDWNGQLADMIRLRDPDNVRVFNRVSGNGYSAEIDRVYADADAWGADCTVELHFNGSANPTVGGCEMLSSGSKGSLELSRSMQTRCLAVMGNSDRRVKVVGKSDRGGRSLFAGRSPAVLIEPYFGSNVKECHTAETRMGDLAEAIYLAAVSW